MFPESKPNTAFLSPDPILHLQSWGARLWYCTPQQNKYQWPLTVHKIKSSLLCKGYKTPSYFPTRLSCLLSHHTPSLHAYSLTPTLPSRILPDDFHSSISGYVLLEPLHFGAWSAFLNGISHVCFLKSYLPFKAEFKSDLLCLPRVSGPGQKGSVIS